MNYDAHLEALRDLGPVEQTNLIQSLGNDDRFCAVVGWLERNREAFINEGSRQALASDHGKLAHAQGSVHAINVLRAQLAALLNPVPVQGGMGQPPDQGEG